MFKEREYIPNGIFNDVITNINSNSKNNKQQGLKKKASTHFLSSAFRTMN